MSTTQERLAVDVAARTIIDHLLCREVHRRIKEEAKTSKESTHPETEENFEEKGSMEIDVVVDDDDDATVSITKSAYIVTDRQCSIARIIFASE